MKDLFNEAEFKILSERMEEIIKEAEHDYYLNINDEKLITLTKGYHYS